MHLSKIFFLCLIFPAPLFAAWSSINFTLGDETIPLINNNEELTLTPFQLSIAAEEKSFNGLRIGAHISKVELDINSASQNINTSADAIGLYLNFPYQFNDYIGLISKLSLTKALANPNTEQDGEVDYLTKKLSLGLSIKWQNFRIIPMISAYSITGDYLNTVDSTSFIFVEKQASFNSIHIDYFVEYNSFIRFSMTEHSNNTFSISFISNY